MKQLFLMYLFTASISIARSQNIGIGVDDPYRAKLEVWGVSGLGITSGYFGNERGITLQRGPAGIGLNQYKDNSQYGRYIGPGWAGLWQFTNDDATQSKGLAYYVFPNGNTDAVISSANKRLEFSLNNRLRILTDGGGINGQLDVGRGTGGDGTAIFMGTNYNSHFNYSTSEHTYIRGGKISSHVYLNDIPNGNVVFGNGSCTVGINTNGYVPPTTLEVRQSNGGMELSNASYPNLPMEWRVGITGNPANFYLYYTNSVRTYFSYTNGSLHPISDARVKTNVQALDPVLEKIMQLRPVTYMMKDAIRGQGRSIGFLAQEVQPLFPILVATHMDDKNDFLGLNYYGFGVIAVKGIQEEQVQLDELDLSLLDIEQRLKMVEQKLKSKH